MWTVTAVSGRVDGYSYNIGSLADPYLCVTNPSTGENGCSPFVTDTLAPVWNYTFPFRFSARTLMNMTTGFSVAMGDDDYGPDDWICGSANYYVASDLLTGMYTFTCGMAGAQFTLRFTPAP